MKRLLLVLALAVPAAASADGYHTVEWFRDHPDAARQTIYWCRNNVGLAGHNPNCANAQDGAMLAQERAMAASGRSPTNWRKPAGSDAMMLNTCRILHDQGVHATPDIAANCRDVGAPGY
jgi:hypothetical protein